MNKERCCTNCVAPKRHLGCQDVCQEKLAQDKILKEEADKIYAARQKNKQYGSYSIDRSKQWEAYNRKHGRKV